METIAICMSLFAIVLMLYAINITLGCIIDVLKLRRN